MMPERKKVLETVEFMREKFDLPVYTGLITGTGLSGTPREITPVYEFNYSQLPHFPVSTAPGHQGRLLVGKMDKKHILVMQGRFHLYEGYSPLQVVYPVRVMQEMGVNTLILTNAAGGLQPDYQPGDIMLIKDHINLTGRNPLAGPNDDNWGLRFPDMTQVYSPALIRLAGKIAQKEAIRIQKGVYTGLLGPSLEAPAEIRFLKTIGTDAVGMSTIMEAIAAVHAGMDILGLSLITNTNDPDSPSPATLESVLETAQASLPKLNQLIAGIIRQLLEGEIS